MKINKLNLQSVRFFALLFLLDYLIFPPSAHADVGAYVAAAKLVFMISISLTLILFVLMRLFKSRNPILFALLSFPAFCIVSWYALIAIDTYYYRHRGQLIDAAIYGSPDELRKALEEVGNPNVRDANGETALVAAARKGDMEKIKLLVNSGADVNVRNKDGSTPLSYAALGGKVEIIQFLLEHGAKITDINPLSSAIYGEHPEALRTLLEQGANVDIRNSYGETALILAARQKRPASLTILINSGANINLQDNDGRTALHKAVMSCFTNEAEILLKAGADINIKDKYGDTAKDLATHSGKKEIENLLKNTHKTK